MSGNVVMAARGWYIGNVELFVLGGATSCQKEVRPHMLSTVVCSLLKFQSFVLLRMSLSHLPLPLPACTTGGGGAFPLNISSGLSTA